MKVLILHGLNNTKESFIPLGNDLKAKGYDPIYLSLLGHDSYLEKDLTWAAQKIHLKKQLDNLDHNEEYYFIGFSQGAVAFQNALNEGLVSLKIKKQLLLAPALKIHNQAPLGWIVNKLNMNIPTPSRTPKDVSQFNFLYASYYKILFEEIDLFSKADFNKLNQIPTSLIIDPEDELVSTKGIREIIYQNKMDKWNIVPFPRNIPIHKQVFSAHHTIFFSTYFTTTDWDKLLNLITNFLK